MTTNNPTAAGIAWLQSDEGLAKFPLDLGGATLRYDILATGCARFWLDDGDDTGWRRVYDSEALALVEHAWRVELEGRILAVRGELVINCPSYDARNPYVIHLYTGRRHTVTAPTLVEALGKAREATA